MDILKLLSKSISVNVNIDSSKSAKEVSKETTKGKTKEKTDTTDNETITLDKIEKILEASLLIVRELKKIS